MDLSARTMYGLRALVTLAGARSNSPMSIQAIAQAESLPNKFLEGIMGDLKRGGFVRSRRGANGGYLLARAASEISVLSIIEHLDGPIEAQTFSDGVAEAEMTERQRALLPVWDEVNEATIRVLESYSVQSIADVVVEPRLDDFTPNYQI